MVSKKKSQQSHAKKRAFQRYGVNLNAQQFKEMHNAIKKGKSETLLRQSKTRRIISIEHSGEKYFAAYDSSRSQIATFLTKNMVDRLIEESKEKGKEEEQEKQEREEHEHINCRSLQNFGCETPSRSGSVGHQHDQGLEGDLEQE